MKMAHQLASVLVLLALFTQCIPCFAATVDYSPDLSGKSGTLRGKIELNKLAGVEIPRGRVFFKGDRMEVSTVPEWQFDRVVVLSGPVLSAQAKVENGQATIRGLAYFQEGDWLGFISPAVPRETIVTDDGEISGRITGIAHNTIDFVQMDGKQTSIPVSSVRDLRSPRAYTFHMQAAAPGAVDGQAFHTEMYHIAMQPKSHVFQATALKSELRKHGDGDLSTGQLLAIGAVINAIQVAQMTPLLVFPMTSPHLSRQANRLIFETNNNPIAVQPVVSVPVQLVPLPHNCCGQ